MRVKSMIAAIFERNSWLEMDWHMAMTGVFLGFSGTVLRWVIGILVGLLS
jgi:hypothetical protein